MPEGALVRSDATRPTALLHDARTCTAQLHNGRGTICLDKRCHGRWTPQVPTRSAQAMDRTERQGRDLCVGRCRGDLITPAIGGTNACTGEAPPPSRGQYAG